MSYNKYNKKGVESRVSGEKIAGTLHTTSRAEAPQRVKDPQASMQPGKLTNTSRASGSKAGQTAGAGGIRRHARKQAKEQRAADHKGKQRDLALFELPDPVPMTLEELTELTTEQVAALATVVNVDPSDGDLTAQLTALNEHAQNMQGITILDDLVSLADTFELSLDFHQAPEQGASDDKSSVSDICSVRGIHVDPVPSPPPFSPSSRTKTCVTAKPSYGYVVSALIDCDFLSDFESTFLTFRSKMYRAYENKDRVGQCLVTFIYPKPSCDDTWTFKNVSHPFIQIDLNLEAYAEECVLGFVKNKDWLSSCCDSRSPIHDPFLMGRVVVWEGPRLDREVYTFSQYYRTPVLDPINRDIKLIYEGMRDLPNWRDKPLAKTGYKHFSAVFLDGKLVDGPGLEDSPKTWWTWNNFAVACKISGYALAGLAHSPFWNRIDDMHFEQDPLVKLRKYVVTMNLLREQDKEIDIRRKPMKSGLVNVKEEIWHAHVSRSDFTPSTNEWKYFTEDFEFSMALVNDLLTANVTTFNALTDLTELKTRFTRVAAGSAHINSDGQSFHFQHACLIAQLLVSSRVNASAALDLTPDFRPGRGFM
jgi:hypothetical protein